MEQSGDRANHALFIRTILAGHECAKRSGVRLPFALVASLEVVAGILDTTGGTLPPVLRSRPWSAFTVIDGHRAMFTAWTVLQGCARKTQ
jgi:hypothetical protein